MPIVWFCLVATALAGYVILDGFDLGAGIAHLLIARNDQERRLVLKSIGPVWDGNEVWLLAGGGTLYFAFPALYSSAFSGFYLPLMIVLWLLILRGCAIEFRNHLSTPTWTPLWDTVFGGASAFLAIFFGAALGNVLRGVPLDEAGDFFLPLWTNFQPGSEPGILDWYTILIAVFAFVTLTLHGALWLNLKTDGDLQLRARRLAMLAVIAVVLLTAIATPATFAIQPQTLQSFSANPWGFAFPAIALASLAGVFLFLRRHHETQAFLASCTFIGAMLSSAAFGIFPYVLPASGDASRGLTVYKAAAPDYGLTIGLWWWIPGMLIALGYTFFVYRHFAGKVTAESGAH
jgi:cytochrome d ubiquinol oxidase subunit II